MLPESWRVRNLLDGHGLSVLAIAELKAYITKEEEHAKHFAQKIASFGDRENELTQAQNDLQVRGVVE